MNRNQLDNIFERLKPKLILYQEGLQLDAMLQSTQAPQLRLGRWDEAMPDTLFSKVLRCAPAPQADEVKQAPGPTTTRSFSSPPAPARSRRVSC